MFSVTPRNKIMKHIVTDFIVTLVGTLELVQKQRG